MSKKLTRREFLKRSALLGTSVAGAAILNACAPAPTSTPVPPTAAPKPAVPTTAPAAPATAVPQPTVAAPIQPAGKITVWFPNAPCAEGSNPERLAAVKKIIRDATGVDVVSIQAPPGTAGTEKLNLLVSSKTEELDVFNAEWPNYKDIVLPLNDLLDKYGQNVLKAYKDLWAPMKDSTGKIYGWPRSSHYGHTHRIWFRTDWLDELKLKMPQTWDEMEMVITEFKKAKPDSFVLTSNQTDLMRCTVGGWTEFGYSNFVDPKDKLLKPYFLQPGFDDWLNRMVEWWKKDWFDKETYANVDVRAKLNTRRVGVYAGWYSRITLWWEQIRTDGKLTKEDFGLAPPIKGPKGLCMSITPQSTNAYMITRKCKNPEAVIKYLNWIFTGFPQDLTNIIIPFYGEENVDWKWVDKSKQTFQQLISQCGKRYDGQLGLHWGMPENYLLLVDASGQVNRHLAHINKYASDYSAGKMPVDFDVPYDIPKIRNEFPGLNDFNRLVNEEIAKFLTTQRPMTQWPDFLKQVQGAGLDQWIKAHTAQFRQYHPG